MELPLRVAISQPHMHWSIDEHVADTRRTLERAAGLGAQLVTFPELTLTGRHTKVPQLLDRKTIANALRAVATACSEMHIGAAFGAPEFSDGERPYDAYFVVDENGDTRMTSQKMRLMPPGEPMIFEAGTRRPVLNMFDTTLVAVMCREMLDHDELTTELGLRARVILWPGVMARGPYVPHSADDYGACAVRVATEQQAWIIHSNWATNIQIPGLPNTGKSMVIAPSGEIMLEAPAQEPGLLLPWKEAPGGRWAPD